MELLRSARVAARPRLVHALAPLSSRVEIGRFAIVCPPRTGSGLLASLLDSQPGVRCEGEILKDVAEQPNRALDGSAVLARGLGARLWGCKIITMHLQWYERGYGAPVDFVRDLVDRGHDIVLLRRRDLLMQALSAAHAVRTKYHFTADDRVSRDAMDVDPERILYLLYAIEEQDRLAASIAEHVDHVPLWYEDDLLTEDAQRKTIDRLAPLLGYESAPFRTDLVPGLPPRLHDRVANLEALEAVLEPTRYRDLLEASARRSDENG